MRSPPGTHGALPGIEAAGAPVEFPGIDSYRVVSGKMVGMWLALEDRVDSGHQRAAKGGVIDFAYALAYDLAPGICVSVPAPGRIETDKDRRR